MIHSIVCIERKRFHYLLMKLWIDCVEGMDWPRKGMECIGSRVEQNKTDNSEFDYLCAAEALVLTVECLMLMLW